MKAPILRVSTFVFAMLLPLAAYSTWDYIETTRLAERVSAISAKGEPVSVWQARSSRTPLLPKSEAHRLYRAAAAMVRIGEGADNTEALHLLDRAVALPFEGFPPGMGYDYFQGDLFSLSIAAGRRTRAALSGTDSGGAATALLAELRLQNMIVRQGFNGASLLLPRVIDHLAEVIRRTQLHPEILKTLEESIVPLDDDLALKRQLMLDRAGQLETTLPSWRFPGNGPPPWRLHGKVGVIDVQTASIAAADLPWPGRLDAFGLSASWSPNAETFPERSDTVSRHAYEHKYEASAFAWTLATIRCARVVIAVERYRRARNERVPSKLEELIPEYLNVPPIDPYSGRALRFATRDAGYVAYTVAFNRVDDGGLVEMKVPYPTNAVASDLGILIQNPSSPNP